MSVLPTQGFVGGVDWARTRRRRYGICPVRAMPGHGERRVYGQGEVVAVPVCGHPPIGAISFAALPGSRGLQRSGP